VAARVAFEIIAWRVTEGLDLFSLMPQTPNFTTSFHATPSPPLMLSSNVTLSIFDPKKTSHLSFEITSSVGFEAIHLIWKTSSGNSVMPVHLDGLSSPYHALYSTTFEIPLCWRIPGAYAIKLEVRDFSCNTFEATLLDVSTLPSIAQMPPKHEGIIVWIGQALGIFKNDTQNDALDELLVVKNSAAATFIAVGTTNPKCWTTLYTVLFYTHCFLHVLLYIFLLLSFFAEGLFFYLELYEATLPLVTAYQYMHQCSHCLTPNLKTDDPCLVHCRNGHSIHSGCLYHLISRECRRTPRTPTCKLDVPCPVCRFSTAPSCDTSSSHHFTPETLVCAGGGARGIGAWWLLSGNEPFGRVPIELFAAKMRARMLLRMEHQLQGIFAEQCAPRLFVTAFAFRNRSHHSKILASMRFAVVAMKRLSFFGSRSYHRKLQENVMCMVFARVTAGQAATTREALRHRGLQLVSSSNSALAVKVFEAGSVLGSTRCMAELSWMLCNGRLGVKQDGEKAFELASRGVRDEDCADCMAALSKCLADGVGCERDFKRSIQFARDSAETGSRLGQYQLGALNYDSSINISHKYNRSQIRDMNARVAVHYFNLSAAQNLPSALFKLGCMREIGGGPLSLDYAEAVRHYRAASALGHPDAYYRLARCYERGRGVQADANRAIDMFIRAHETGIDTATIRDHLLRLGANLPPLTLKQYMHDTNDLGADCFFFDTVVMSLGFLIEQFVSFISYPWFAAKRLLGKKAIARIKFTLASSIIVPNWLLAFGIYYQFAIQASVLPCLLMLSPWLFAACTLARRQIHLIIGDSPFLDWCHECGCFFLGNVYFSTLMAWSSDFLLGYAWYLTTGKSLHEFAWSDPPYDAFVFAQSFCSQCFACYLVFYLYSLLLFSL
jgi:TPR repeat protein